MLLQKLFTIVLWAVGIVAVLPTMAPGQVNPSIDINSRRSDDLILLEDHAVSELPLDVVQYATVIGSIDLQKKLGETRNLFDSFDGTMGDDVKIIDSAHGIDDDEYLYKVVKGKVKEVKISRKGDVLFHKVKILSGKHAGREGWLPSKLVGKVFTGDFEVRMRVFIPCEVVTLSPVDMPIIFRIPNASRGLMNPFELKNPSLGGDNRGFSYDQGTHRAAQSVRGRIDVGRGPVATPSIQMEWMESHSYSPSQTTHVTGRPWWWFKLKPGMEAPVFTARLERTDLNNKAEIEYSDSGKKATIKMFIDGSVPLLEKAPSINLNLNVVVEKSRQEKDSFAWRIVGAHDPFPSFEVYINKNLVYSHEADAKDGPFALTNKFQRPSPLFLFGTQVMVDKKGTVGQMGIHD
jgi:hypothetical protein